MFEEYEFEWDPQKAAENARRHGLTFERTRTIWDDERRYIYPLTKCTERRWLAIGRLGPQVYMTAIITYRGERIRIISARFSSRREIERYHNG